MELTIELNESHQRTCDDLGKSNAFVADDLLSMLNDACALDAPDKVVLSKTQVALLTLLGQLGFAVVACYQAHLLKERGIDHYAADPLIDVLMDILSLKKKNKGEKGEDPSLK